MDPPGSQENGFHHGCDDNDWFATDKPWPSMYEDDEGIGEQLELSDGAYDPEAVYFLQEAHKRHIIQNIHVDALGRTFGEVYTRLSRFIEESGKNPDDFFIDIGIFESWDKTE